MAGWYLSEQARQVLRAARDLARGRRALGSADPLLVAILERWDDERFGGPALLRACGLTADQASRLATTLLPAEPAEAAVPDAEPRIIGTLRFVLDQAERIAAEARASYVGTEHLVVAILWQDCFIGAQELRRHGVGYAQARERLASAFHEGVVAGRLGGCRVCERRPGRHLVAAGAAVRAGGYTWACWRAAWRDPVGGRQTVSVAEWVSSAAAETAAGRTRGRARRPTARWLAAAGSGGGRGGRCGRRHAAAGSAASWARRPPAGCPAAAPGSSR
jgi:hypothetical protein